MNDLIQFENPEDVRVLRLYLTRSGRGGYIVKSELIDQLGKCHRAEKAYRKKQFNDMRVIIGKLVDKLTERGIPKNKISCESMLMRFNETA